MYSFHSKIPSGKVTIFQNCNDWLISEAFPSAQKARDIKFSERMKWWPKLYGNCVESFSTYTRRNIFGILLDQSEI